jgi:hypothetical protein
VRTRARELGTRIVAWRPGRRAAIAVLAICPVAGAAIALALDTSSGNGERAQALVLVGASDAVLSRAPEVRAGWTRTAAAIADSGQTAAVARSSAARATGVARGTLGERAPRVDIRADPPAGVVEVSTRAGSRASALALADAVALQTATLARGLAVGANGSAGVSVGDFEGSLDGWLGPSLFNSLPTSVGTTKATPRFGRGSLLARCPGIPGCGPSAQVFYPFRAGAGYTAVMWLRASGPGVRASALLGSAANDVATSPALPLSRGWRRLAVAWTPRRASADAEIGVQLQSRRSTAIGVDGVAILDPFQSRSSRQAFTPAAQSRALAAGRYVTVSPARAIGVETAPAIERASVGAGAGLIVALAAIAAAEIARRRRERKA